MDQGKAGNNKQGWIVLAVASLTAIALILIGLLYMQNNKENSIPYSGNNTQQTGNTEQTNPIDTSPVTTRVYKSYTEVMGTDECTYDCSGHEAGWAWAEEHKICDDGYSNGGSESFNVGVREWTEYYCSQDENYNYYYDN